MKLEIIAATTFGLEAIVRREIEALGYKIIKTEDGKVTFMGDERAMVRANLWLRTADRVQVKMAEFHVTEFEDIYQNMRGIRWEELRSRHPKGGRESSHRQAQGVLSFGPLP